MEPQIFPFFSALKRNIQKNSVTVSSRSPGCSTAIESRIPALTARVLQLYAAVPVGTSVFTTVMRKYAIIVQLIILFWVGLVAIALEELIIVPPVYLLEKC